MAEETKQSDFKDKIILLFMVLAVGLGFVFYLSHFRAKPKEGSSQLKESQVPVISSEEVKQKLDAGEDIVILDTRSREDYKTKHIKGSLSMPQDEIYVRYSDLPQDKEIIVLCYTTGCQSSTQVAQVLLELGFSNVKDMKTGISGWEAQGFPLEGEYIASATQEAKVESISPAQLKIKLDTNQNIYLIDVREKEEYKEAHIEKAHSLPLDQISSQLDKLPKDKEIIIYSKTGHQSKLACQYLLIKNFEKVKEIAGGFEAWVEAGYSVMR